MCEANVYVLGQDGKEKLYLEAVDKFIPGVDGIYIENIYGERRTVKAKIKEMALVDHRIIIEDIED